ncbi:hypothetical protein [Hydrogenophaga sp. PBL-H3]|uniref:hypothetical protein n=1 Tax=Hydrogenophaga sp. PBL-H3 TaxID=434010 RepID=UPI001320484A|nr:hypothetical protein [Hydrogenophaga sp. PBL-H3]QHE74731.1 hypothetical protein F9Z45_01055 [Hydrogenophaga sp. PBL-H3]QHE79157.1 hypothetical protein F9Z44_01055 [Hydrogenophaga sp. PBL-H3]
MTRASLSRILTALCAAITLTAQAAEQGGKSDPQRKATSVTFHKAPSEESPAARERRLKHECKGRANAGMCLGHTR